MGKSLEDMPCAESQCMARISSKQYSLPGSSNSGFGSYMRYMPGSWVQAHGRAQGDKDAEGQANKGQCNDTICAEQQEGTFKTQSAIVKIGP